jgi:hypothetical protein
VNVACARDDGDFGDNLSINGPLEHICLTWQNIRVDLYVPPRLSGDILLTFFLTLALYQKNEEMSILFHNTPHAYGEWVWDEVY